MQRSRWLSKPDLLEYFVYYSMVRQLSAGILILLVLASNLGMVVHQHYCCGKLKDESISFFNEVLSCDRSMQMENRECCEDRYQRISEDHEYSQDSHAFEPVLYSFDVQDNPVCHQVALSSLSILPDHYRPPPLVPHHHDDFSILII